MAETMVQVNAERAQPVLAKRIAFLTNILLQHDVAAFEALRPLVGQLRIFLSAAAEPDRREPVSWGRLDVVVQRSLRWSRSFTNAHGYRDVKHLRIPYDTLFQLARYKPDLVLSNQFGMRTVFAVLFCILRPRTRLIVWATLSQRTAGAHDGLRTTVRKAILRRADACFVHGSDGETYIRSLGFRGPIVHTPYVSDPSRYHGESMVPDDDVLRILFTGQLIERKGIYQFTKALCTWCRQHPNRHVVYQVGGEGPELERLRQLSFPDNLQVEFLGYLNVEQSVLAYRRASIYTFPTLGDEWGMVVNEALCMGLPVLASVHAQGSLELVQDGDNGWLFDPQDEERLAANLERALGADRETLRTMSLNARRSVTRWSPERMAEVRAEAFRSLLETSHEDAP